MDTDLFFSEIAYTWSSICKLFVKIKIDFLNISFIINKNLNYQLFNNKK